jgi:hypothetical protein
MPNISRIINTIKRYCKKNESSLSFWWLPLSEEKDFINLTAKTYKNYYINFERKCESNSLFDEQGVIMLDYKGDIGTQYNPCATAQYGLGLLAKYQRAKDTCFYEKAMVQADWLIKNAKIDKNNIARYEYGILDNNLLSQNALPLPIISSIAQGQAVSFLSRVFILSKDTIYLSAAEQAFNSFLFNIHEGGVAHTDKDGYLFLEEIPTLEISCILDGFIYAVYGVYDYFLLTGDTRAEEIFKKCLQTLKYILPEYDLGFWSRADCFLKSPKMPASNFYHHVHILQLNALYKITNDQIFSTYAARWQRYQKNILQKYLALMIKIWCKIFYY